MEDREIGRLATAILPAFQYSILPHHPKNMLLRSLYIFCILSFMLTASSCRSSKYSPGPKEYIEKHGLNDQRKPHELAKEFGAKGKREKKAYRKQLKRAAKDIKKRNRKKVKGGYYEKK